MLKQLKRLLPKGLKSRLRRWVTGHDIHTYYFAQGGEDNILQLLFLDLTGNPITQIPGTYVDIGAFDPVLHSNTYIFYMNGWSGINVDPRPGFKARFDRVRPLDINVEAGIAATTGEMPFYIIGDDSTMNTFSRSYLEQHGLLDHIRETISVRTLTLTGLLDQFLPPGRTIDLLNIDAEGLDLEVLRSNNWAKYRPKVICAELNPVLRLEDVQAHETCRYLEGLGYRAIAKNFITRSVSSVIFADESFLKS